MAPQFMRTFTMQSPFSSCQQLRTSSKSLLCSGLNLALRRRQLTDESSMTHLTRGVTLPRAPRLRSCVSRQIECVSDQNCSLSAASSRVDELDPMTPSAESAQNPVAGERPTSSHIETVSFGCHHNCLSGVSRTAREDEGHEDVAVH